MPRSRMRWGRILRVVLHGSHLSEIAAAVTNGSLSPEGAVHVIANLVAALASDPSATVRNWAVSQLDHYVDDGLVDAQTVSSVLMDATAHATTTGLISLGAIMGTLGGGLAAIHDAIADGSLPAEQGLDLLLSIGAVRDIGDPVFQAARDEIVALVQDGALTGTQVLAVTRAAGAAGWLSESHVEVIAFSIFGDGSAADDAAVGAYAATRVDHLGDRFGVGDDTYFTGILAETGVTFLKVQNGQMTAAAAIAHIKEYAAEHDVSAYAGIFALEGLFQRYQNGAARTLAHDTRVDMIALGDLAAELAGRVAEGTTSAYVRSAQGGTQFEAADPNALTRAEALQVLNWEAGLAFTQEQVALARYMFANDLWVAQQVRLDSSPTSPISMTNVVNGMLPGNPFFNTSVPDVGRSGYAYDLALVSLLEQVTAPDRVPDQQDYTHRARGAQHAADERHRAGCADLPVCRGQPHLRTGTGGARHGGRRDRARLDPGASAADALHVDGLAATARARVRRRASWNGWRHRSRAVHAAAARPAIRRRAPHRLRRAARHVLLGRGRPRQLPRQAGRLRGGVRPDPSAARRRTSR